MSTTGDFTLSAVLRDILAEQGLDLHGLAERCDVTYQTVKNLLDGKSVSARFITRVIKEFKVERNQPLLRRLLLATLMVQFPPGEGERLLLVAGLLEKK